MTHFAHVCSSIFPMLFLYLMVQVEFHMVFGNCVWIGLLRHCSPSLNYTYTSNFFRSKEWDNYSNTHVHCHCKYHHFCKEIFCICQILKHAYTYITAATCTLYVCLRKPNRDIKRQNIVLIKKTARKSLSAFINHDFVKKQFTL